MNAAGTVEVFVRETGEHDDQRLGTATRSLCVGINESVGLGVYEEMIK